MIRNAIAYLVAKQWAPDEERMSRRAFMPCGALDMDSRGFVPPRGGAGLVLTLDRLKLICLQTESKLLPASVVSMEVKHRADQLEEQQGFRPGRRQIRELKERVIEDLLPRAFVRQQRTFAWLDIETSTLFIDAASPAKAEELIESLRDAHEEMPIRRLDTAKSPSSGMLDWLASGEASQGFTIDRDLELRTPDEERATVRYTNHALEGDDVAAHIAAGKRAVKMAMTHEDSLSFVLTEQGGMRRIRALDILVERLGEFDSAEDEFDSTFLLEATSVSKAFFALVSALGGMREDLAEIGKAADPSPYYGPDEDDPLYAQAVGVVVGSGRASTSLVQQHLRIGYNRAARLIEQMEKRRVVSVPGINGARTVIKEAA